MKTRVLNDQEAIERAGPALMCILKPSLKVKEMLKLLEAAERLSGTQKSSLWNLIAHYRMDLIDQPLVEYAMSRSKAILRQQMMDS